MVLAASRMLSSSLLMSRSAESEAMARWYWLSAMQTLFLPDATYVFPNVAGSKISKDLYFFDNLPFTD